MGRGCSRTSCVTPYVSHLLDGGASIEEIADLTGDDPVTLYRHYRHRVPPVASVAARLEGSLGLNGSQDGSPDTLGTESGEGGLTFGPAVLAGRGGGT